MIRHCVLLKWKPEVTDEHKAAFADALRQLSQSLPGIVSYRCGTDAGINQGNFDFGVFGDFRTRADYERYRDDAFHKEIIAQYITDRLDGRAALQLEV